MTRADDKKSSTKAKVGRISAYTKSLDEKFYRLALLGSTDKEICQIFEIPESTFSKWKNDYPSMLEALKRGKEDADGLVAKSLYRRAIGYSHPDVDIKCFEGEIIKTDIIKHYPPDTTAAIFWLKNRQREKWRDVQRLEHTGKDGGPVETHNASVDDLLSELVKRGESLPTCAVIPISQRS